VASANPEDYTNRGRIITPLKDRFGSQVRTHYPLDLETEMAVADQEAVPFALEGMRVVVPSYMAEIVATLSQLARESAHVNQRSGVSVRFSIGNLETLQASAVRRAVRCDEPEAVPRPCDLPALLQSSLGRIEFETFEEGRETEIVARMLRQAILDVYRRRLGGFDFSKLVQRFEDGLSVETSDLVSADVFLKQLGTVPGLANLMKRLGVADESPSHAASALEFALEGLHLSRRLNKEEKAGAIRYGA
jgi:magnesium chelatase subunit I